MSWVPSLNFFGKTASPSQEVSTFPGVTPLQQQRIKQIESLTTFNYNVSEEERDKEYRIKFNAAGKSYNLKISLPERFPNERPIVKLSPDSKHVWLDENMYVVGCTTLNNFYMHSNLGKVVKEIVDKFKEDPPVDLPFTVHSNGLPSHSPTFNRDQTRTSQGSIPPSNHNTPTAVLISTDSMECDEQQNNTVEKKNPSECKTLEELIDLLRQMPMEDLEKFSENADPLLQHVMNMEMLKDFKKQRLTLVENNEKLAEHNLTFKPKIEDRMKSLEDCRGNLELLQAQFQTNCSKQDEISQVFNVNHIVTNLRIAISEGEESTEEIADHFLEKKLPLDEFLQTFLAQRKMLHLRKAKEERIRCQFPQY